MARRLRTWLRRLKARSKRRTATSITELKDHLGHGPEIRAALARGELPRLESLAGLGAERYTDEVFARMHARIVELAPRGSVPESLRKLAPLVLAGTAGTAESSRGVDSATLRALLMFSIVEAQLVRFERLSVVEIGGGIGSFAAVVLTLSEPASYAFYDLPDMLALQRGYLSRVLPREKLERVRFRSAYELSPVAPFDLVYSTYAFSELARRVAEQYFESVVRHARMGFMTYNHLGARFGIDNLSAVDFCGRLLASGGIESVEVRADEHYRLGAGGDESCCNLLWRRATTTVSDAGSSALPRRT